MSQNIMMITLPEVLERLQAKIEERIGLNKQGATVSLKKKLDTDICLLVRRTFTRFVDYSGLLEEPDSRLINKLQRTFKRALDDALTTTYPGSEKFRISVEGKLTLLAEIKSGMTLEDVLNRAVNEEVSHLQA